MSVLRIALLQMAAESNQQASLEKGIQFCRRAKAMGADIALFPEMWNTGYFISEDSLLLEESAVDRSGPFVTAFQNLAQELEMAIGITYLERFQPAPRNTLTLFDRFGKEVLTYAKVHTCDFVAEAQLTPGDKFYTATLDTAVGPVQVGAMICYDREFPESARILMLQGAEVILVPNACPMELNRLSQLRTRSYENMVAIATANYAVGSPHCNGHSSAFDGIAYDSPRHISRDTLVVEAGENEDIFLASFPLDKLRAYRETEIQGNTYRHPRKYLQLVEEKIAPPFERSDYRP